MWGYRGDREIKSTKDFFHKKIAKIAKRGIWKISYKKKTKEKKGG